MWSAVYSIKISLSCGSFYRSEAKAELFNFVITLAYSGDGVVSWKNSVICVHFSVIVDVFWLNFITGNRLVYSDVGL